jgi:hypothetical protein
MVRTMSIQILLIASALFLTAAALKDSRTDHHESETASSNYPIEQREPQGPSVPLTVLESVQAALSEAVGTIKQQAKTADKQAEANIETWSSPSVLVNIALAIAGFGYLFFACLQWKAIHAQVGVANQTLVLSNRPRIKVRTFVIKPSNRFEFGMPVDIECQVVNWGGTDAYIVESNCTITDHPESAALPMVPPYSPQSNSFQIKNGVLPAGLAFPMYQPSNITIPHPKRDVFGGSSGADLYVFGYIFYRNGLENSRTFYRTAFCRRYDFSQHRFVPVGNADYEHED